MKHGLSQNSVHAGLIALPFLLEPRHNIGIQFAGNGNFYRLKHLTLFPGAEFGKIGYQSGKSGVSKRNWTRPF
jgi:hypothetical protein